jgi:large repetitive protein
MARKTLQPLLLLALAGFIASPSLATLEGRTAEVRVNQRTDFKQRNPATAFSPAGASMVVWENDQRGIRAVHFSRSGVAGTEIVLLENQAVDADHVISRRQPAIVFLSEGTFGLAWTEELSYEHHYPFIGESRLIDQDVYFQRFNTSGAAVGQRQKVNTATDQREGTPRLIARGGKVLALWEDAAGGVFVRSLESANAPAVRINGAAGANAAIAAAGNRYLAVWEAEDGDTTGVFARLLDANGTPLAPASRLNTQVVGRQRRPAVSGDGNDGFFVAWQHDASTRDARLFGRRVTGAGALVGGELALATPGSGPVQMNPTVTLVSPGRFLVTWVAWPDWPQPIRYPGVFLGGRLFDLSGAPRSPVVWISERRIDTNFRRTTVSTDGNGRFVAAWSSAAGKLLGVAARWLVAD